MELFKINSFSFFNLIFEKFHFLEIVLLLNHEYFLNNQLYYNCYLLKLFPK
jgi:hypothetical protein